MLLKLRGLDGRIMESEVDTRLSFATVCDKAGKAFGYHGSFTIRLPSGELAQRSENLEDNEEFMAQKEGFIFDLVQDQPAAYVAPTEEAKTVAAVEFKVPEALIPAPVEVPKPVEPVSVGSKKEPAAPRPPTAGKKG